jgi:glycosyltransferase involved in cell wall biosynthesis
MSNLNNPRLKALSLASWYPNEDHPLSGIFVKRHVQAVSKYCDICVLYVHMSQHRKKLSVESTIEDGIKTIRVYNAASKSFFLKGLFGAIKYYYSCLKGLEVVKKEFGKPDIIHAHVIRQAGILALILNVFTGIPYVLTEHSSQFRDHYSSNFYKLLCLKIMQRARKILPVSHSLEIQMRDLYHEKKYLVVPNVVDTTVFIPNHISKNQRSIKKILHVSLLNDEHKNVTGIIKAINELLNIRTDFEMHIIGDGPDRLELENLASDLKLLNRYIFFQGRVDDKTMKNLMQNSNFFVLNSRFETFAIVCTEALSAGMPVISTRCGGPEEYITNESGILIEPGNNGELVNAINYMLDNSSKYDPEKLHKYIEDRFSYDAVGLMLYTIYRSV